MNESAHGPTVPWLDRLLLAVLLVCVAVTATYVVSAADGKTVLPHPLNSLIFVVLATTVLGILIRRAQAEIIRRIDQLDRRRAEQVAGEVTRDLSRSRVIASVPAVVGLDSGVVEIGSRLARRLNEGSER